MDNKNEVSLKEYAEEKISHLNDKIDEVWHKVKILQKNTDAKLVKMNEIREQLNDQGTTFATKVDIENLSKMIEKNQNDNERRLAELEKKAYTLQGSATVTDKSDERKASRVTAIVMMILGSILTLVNAILGAYLISRLPK